MFLALEKEFQMGLSSEILFLEREKFVYFTFTLFLISQRQKKSLTKTNYYIATGSGKSLCS